MVSSHGWLQTILDITAAESVEIGKELPGKSYMLAGN